MSYDQDVANAINGVTQDGRTARPWAWARVRARTVFGNLSKLKPFTWPNPTFAGTTSALDHLIGTAENVAWRYVASDGRVYDHKDATLVLLEDLIERRGADGMQTLIGCAKVLRGWPGDYPGAPDFERGNG